MQTPLLTRKTYLLISVLTAALLPVIMMFLSQLMVGIPVGDAVAELGESIARRKLNPAITAIPNLPVFAVLTLIAVMYHKKVGAKKAFYLYTGGYIGAMLCLLWAHLSFWPKHYRSGPLPFPHGLEMVIGPMFALATAAAGILIGWMFARSRPTS